MIKATTITPYYKRSGITIYCGDCLKVMPELENKCIDISITSPPYNMRNRLRNGKYIKRGNEEHFSKKYSNFDDALPIEDYYNLHVKVIQEMLRISQLLFWNIQIVTGSKEAIFRIIGRFAKEIRDIITWDKGNAIPATNPSVINRGSELILIFEPNGQAGRTFQKSKFKHGTMNDIWRMGRGGKDRIKGHSATFPRLLVSNILTGWADEQDTILDPFMGTGTTLVAAQNEGRQAVGIEISEEYCKIAVDRLKQISLFSIPSIEEESEPKQASLF